MRIFGSTKEAFSEVGRDLVEMGVENKSDSVQGWVVDSEDNDFDMKELIGYAYSITWNDDIMSELTPPERDYARIEHEHRIDPRWINPGIAWKARRNLWEPMLNDNGMFDYTYNERMRTQLGILISELQIHPNTRQAVITIYDKFDQHNLGGKKRVPCSLHYQFIRRNDFLHMIYSMRSCDYFAHYKVDVVLALMLLEYVASKINCRPEYFTHNIGSFHCFRKDWKDAGIF